MAADQDRAERIHKLKRERPDLTWRAIADYVGTTERAAIEWGQNGGIAYDNAKKLAALFEVDVDYIWRGKPTAPDLFKTGDDQLDRLEAKLDALTELVRQLAVGPVPLPSGELGRVLAGEPPTPPTEKPVQRRPARAARSSTG